MQKLLTLAERKNYRVFFLGATEDVIRRAVDKIKKLFPKLMIAGYRNGYWSEKEEESVVNTIKHSSPDILFVGISSPKKEYFLNTYISKMNVPFSMGVGGSFDVIAGKKSRAPLLLQKCGLEWFWRLMQEPRRMWKRYLIGNVIFIWLVIKELFKKIF